MATKKPESFSRCPGCAGALRVSQVSCPDCGLVISGDFSGSRLGLLSAEQQRFAEVFLASRGNIRVVEQVLGVSYPTVRKRLDELVAVLGGEAVEAASSATRRDDVLSQIERGELTAKEGIRILRELKEGGHE